MATPFIAGFASYVGTYLRTTSPKSIWTAINRAATLNVVTNAKTKNDNLPYFGFLRDKYLIPGNKNQKRNILSNNYDPLLRRMRKNDL